MKKTLLFSLLLFTLIATNAQVKIGDNPGTINTNSLLELESANKGFLPPRVQLNDAASVAPLTGTVPAGMLVFSSGGALADGYYYWNGTSWVVVGNTEMVTKSANATLVKSERFVLASGDITITLPSITSVDNGLTVVVKNTGTHTDRVKVKGNGSSTIDGRDSSILTRWVGRTFVAYGGNWITKEKESQAENILDVSPEGSWTTLEEALEYLGEHMYKPAIIRLSSGTYSIEETQVIDLDFPLTIQGTSYGKTTLEADAALAGNPMFRCLSEAYFKMIAFDGTSHTAAGEDAIQFETGGEYFEIKDCSFEGFNKTLVLESNVELWVFEVDIKDAVAAGIEVAAGSTTGVSLKISEVDFTNCAIGVNLATGENAIVSILNSTFYNGAGDIGIKYVPDIDGTPVMKKFHAFSSMFITNNAWNNIGTFITGFDFSRTDGRDSKAFIQSNAGDPDRNPNCHINVINSGTATTITATWTKVNWNHNNATPSAAMWTVADDGTMVNRITYQPINKRSGWFIISGNLSNSSPNRTISLGVVKNGNSTTRLGETTIRMASSGAPYPFSIVIYLSDIAQNDYFELYASDTNGESAITMLDLQWYAETK